jgi:hypothetical protein
MSDINYFIQARDLNVNDKVKEKNKLKYLSWASAWNFMKTVYPDATYRVIKNEKDLHFTYGEEIFYVPEFTPYHTDGRTCWVEVEITANGLSQPQELAVMDFKNQSISLTKITSTDVQKSIARCLTKCCASFGIGIYIYEGEDLPQEVKLVEKLQDELKELISKKIANLGGTEEVKKLLQKTCIDNLPELYNGDYRLCEDSEELKLLKTKILSLRK